MSIFFSSKKMPTFICENCDASCSSELSTKTTSETIGHKRVTSNNKKMPVFVCEKCDFKCSKESNYKIHIETIKHKRVTKDNKKMPNDTLETFNCVCGNEYKYRPGLAKHKRTCVAINTPLEAQHIIEAVVGETHDKRSGTINKETDVQIDDVICSDDKVILTKEMFMTLLKDNQEMIKLIKEQQIMAPRHVTNNNNNNNITNNFNLNVFLNEKCKDALNMTEFIDSLKITLDDLLFSKTNGITRGVTDVMMKRLKELDIYQRPIHCTDIKRDTMYIKDENKWYKDDNHDKFKNTIVQIADKERSALQQWAIDNPDWMETEHKQIQYLTMMRSICEPIENYSNYERKIVKNIGKEILIDK